MHKTRIQELEGSDDEDSDEDLHFFKEAEY